jgi:hypothetical protein
MAHRSTTFGVRVGIDRDRECDERLTKKSPTRVVRSTSVKDKVTDPT